MKRRAASRPCTRVARGLIIGGLLAVVMSNLGIGWELKLSLILVPAVTYLVMALSVSYPKTELVTSNVSTASMWKETALPLFLLLLLCMCMTAAIQIAGPEVSPRDERVIAATQSRAEKRRTVPRLYQQPDVLAPHVKQQLSHKSPIVTMIVSSLLSAVNLY